MNVELEKNKIDYLMPRVETHNAYWLSAFIIRLQGNIFALF